MTRLFTIVAALATLTLALPALATPEAEVGTAGTRHPRRVPASNRAALPTSVVSVGPATPAPSNPSDPPSQVHPLAGAGLNLTAGDHGEGSPAVEGLTVWDRLAECESHGDWGYSPATAEWGSRLFEGGLQFHPDTWDAYKPAGFPEAAYLATRQQQIAVAEVVLEAQGWDAWPACSKKLGLR